MVPAFATVAATAAIKEYDKHNDEHFHQNTAAFF